MLHFNVCSIHEGQKIPTKLVDVLSGLRAAEALVGGRSDLLEDGQRGNNVQICSFEDQPSWAGGCPGQPHQHWTRELGAGV